jgi:hypothetical protein
LSATFSQDDLGLVVMTTEDVGSYRIRRGHWLRVARVRAGLTLKEVAHAIPVEVFTDPDETGRRLDGRGHARREVTRTRRSPAPDRPERGSGAGLASRVSPD